MNDPIAALHVDFAQGTPCGAWKCAQKQESDSRSPFLRDIWPPKFGANQSNQGPVDRGSLTKRA